MLLMFSGVLLGAWAFYRAVGFLIDRVDSYLERKGAER